MADTARTLPPLHTYGEGIAPCDCPTEPCGAVDTANIIPGCPTHKGGDDVTHWGQFHWAGKGVCTRRAAARAQE